VVSIFKLVEGEERVTAPVYQPAAAVVKAVVKPITARAPVKKLASTPAPAPAARPKKVASASAGSDEWEEF